MSADNEYRKLLLKALPRPIHNEQEYKRAMGRLEEIMAPHPSAAASQLIELLSTLIENYETQSYPTPKGSPSRLLKHLIEARGVKCAEIAKETGIGAATLSNILADRRSISKANAATLASYFSVPISIFFEAAPAPKVFSLRRRRPAKQATAATPQPKAKIQPGVGRGSGIGLALGGIAKQGKLASGQRDRQIS